MFWSAFSYFLGKNKAISLCLLLLYNTESFEKDIFSVFLFVLKCKKKKENFQIMHRYIGIYKFTYEL